MILNFTDPGSAAYTAAQLVPTDKEVIRIIVADSGIIVSLDGGVSDAFSMPANTVDNFRYNIPADSRIAVKRYTAGTAFTSAAVEVL